jgi:hypothetical protein
MPIGLRPQPNALIKWTIEGAPTGDTDPITGLPICLPGIDYESDLFLEMNVPSTPLNAEVFDGDNSSEFLRLNLSGHFTGIPGQNKWPPELIAGQLVELEYQHNSSQALRAEAYVYTMGTIGLHRPLRQHGDAIRIAARIKPKYFPFIGFNKSGNNFSGIV